MARYHYTRENENGVVLYLESEPAEDAMDEFDDEIAVGFSGNGYLSFWTRCRKAAEARVAAVADAVCAKGGVDWRNLGEVSAHKRCVSDAVADARTQISALSTRTQLASR